MEQLLLLLTIILLRATLDQTLLFTGLCKLLHAVYVYYCCDLIYRCRNNLADVVGSIHHQVTQNPTFSLCITSLVHSNLFYILEIYTVSDQADVVLCLHVCRLIRALKLPCHLTTTCNLAMF